MSTAIPSPPSFLTKLYAKFPLVVLPAEDSPHAAPRPRTPVIWIHPWTFRDDKRSYKWASPDPDSLRVQLLFLLRSVPVEFRSWSHEAAAPGGTLPALHLPTNEVKSTGEIRGWLDAQHPIQGPYQQYNGIPNQQAYDQALAVGQLVLGRLLPAYLDALPTPRAHLPALFAHPPPLAAGLTTIIPASLTGDARTLDHQAIAQRGIDALLALSELTNDGWALGAQAPSPLDALLASHLHVLGQLSRETELRRTWDSAELEGLRAYVSRVMDVADGRAA